MQDFRERCQQKVAGEIDALFENERARALATIWSDSREFLVLEAPGIKFPYNAMDDELVAMLKPLSCDALITYVQHHLSKPPGFPELPISPDACREMEEQHDKRAQLVGRYGTSQMRARWVKRHPTFKPFCRGLLADERTPPNLRNDLELRQMFPPKPLQGLQQDGYWSTADTREAWAHLVWRVDTSLELPIERTLMAAHMKALAERGIRID
jgi:hypothetical protein